MAAIDEHETGDLWVFGYGSLMWRPGFDALERVPARLKGLHRALCVFSFVHRGTPERPGLVFGLVRALCYTVDRGHVQYAGRLTLPQLVHYVRQGHGSSGANKDYVLDAVHALEALGYRDTELHLLAERLGRHETVVKHQDQLSDIALSARDS
jgi:glutathione-specific gamma-glutamylcyclotransferase